MSRYRIALHAQAVETARPGAVPGKRSHILGEVSGPNPISNGLRPSLKADAEISCRKSRHLVAGLVDLGGYRSSGPGGVADPTLRVHEASGDRLFAEQASQGVRQLCPAIPDLPSPPAGLRVFQRITSSSLILRR